MIERTVLPGAQPNLHLLLRYRQKAVTKQWTAHSGSWLSDGCLAGLVPESQLTDRNLSPMVSQHICIHIYMKT